MNVAILGPMVLLAMLVAGAALLWSGLRRRRVGSAPHCPKCDYNLTGLEHVRCPECGEVLFEHTIVRGERLARRRGRIVAGSFCLAAAVGLPVVGWLTTLSPYALYPTSWVMADVSSSAAPVKNRAWRELMWRFNGGQLSAAQRAAVIELCLAEQGSDRMGSVTSMMVTFLGQCYLDALLSEAQTRMFFEQIITMQWTIRPRVVAGDPVPYELAYRTRGPGHPGSIWQETVAANENVRVDGKALSRGGRSSSGSRPGVGTGSLGRSFSYDEPGAHDVEIAVAVRLYDGPMGRPKQSRLLHEQTFRLTGEFEILAEEPDDYIRLVPDPGQREALMAAVRPDNLRIETRPDGERRFGGMIRIEALPVNIAFDVIARVSGKEHHIGSIYRRKGLNMGWGIGEKYDGPVAASCDLILRTSKDVARRTVDLFEIWDGELVFENVPVERPASSR